MSNLLSGGKSVQLRSGTPTHPFEEPSGTHDEPVAKHIADGGQVASAHVNTPPKWIDGQHYSLGTFAALAAARKAGFTQTQINAYIKQQMTSDGWLKA